MAQEQPEPEVFNERIAAGLCGRCGSPLAIPHRPDRRSTSVCEQGHQQ